jgi:hypothetical protein
MGNLFPSFAPTYQASVSQRLNRYYMFCSSHVLLVASKRQPELLVLLCGMSQFRISSNASAL